MNLQENTTYDISKLTTEQKILLFTNLYYLRFKNVSSYIEKYVATAEDNTYKTLIVKNEYEWYTLQHKESNTICATTLFLKFPRVIQVRDSEQEQWEERVAVFIDHKGRPYTYQAIREVEEIPEEAEENMLYWNYYRELQPKTKLTLQEIADKFNLTAEEIEIV